ncbi:MAG: MBL fold metallo-hydrolase [Candidatus Micrarchaeota archaeon]
MEFFVDCLGASREVGRSAFMLHTDKNIMIDYGIKIFDQTGVPKFPLEENLKPDLAILSHAHLDHSGCIPALYRDNKVHWYSTPPTKEITEVLWLDSMKIMGDGLPYRLGHLNKALKYWNPLLYKKPIQTGQTRIELFDAGHISGAAMVDIEYNGKTFFYTGDFKCEETMMHKGASHIDSVDTLMIESTYAKKEHPPRKEVEERLMEEIYDTLESGGTALLPSFALGRTQELIALIRNYDMNIPVYVDGMGKEITRIYMQYPNYIKSPEKFKKAVRSVNLVNGIPDKKAATREPSVIITTSGMLNGGPVLNYMFNVNSNSKILMTGYCVEGTNGNTLLNHGYITQNGEQLQVDLPVEYLDLSAHAGRSELIEFIKKANPEKVLLVHGDKPEEFAKELEDEHGFDALAPLPGERVILDEEK